MPEETAPTPDQQANSDQQDPGGADNQSQSVNWEARYKGQQAALQRLSQENQDLKVQLAAKSSELEQLQAQLHIKDTEKTVAVGERDKKVEQLLKEAQAAKGELEELRALKAKIEVINGLKRPDLVRLLDKVPNLTDAEQLKSIFEDFGKWADDLVKQREEQLLAGVTQGFGGPPTQQVLPASESEWEQKINSLPLGSPERMKVLEQYGDFLEQKHKS